MKVWHAIAALLFAGPAFAASENRGCGTYSAEVLALPYAGYSDCILRQAREKPLWRTPLQAGVRQHIRLTFTQGHSVYTRVINFEEYADGRGIIRSKTLRRDRAQGLVVSSRKSRRIAPADVQILDRLGLSSGAWEHPTGSWDGDQLFMHCETLDMERVTSSGYRFSSVNISCNQPEKLMPLVQFIANFVDMKTYAKGRVY